MSTLFKPDYGADSAGLICGFHFDHDGLATPVSSQDFKSLSVPAAGGTGFHWLHFSLAHAASSTWMEQNLALPPLFYETLKDGSRSTRVELDDDTLIAVINDVSYDFAFDPSDIATLWLVVMPGMVVSARLQPLRSIDRLRRAVRNGERLCSPVELLVSLMRDQADVLVSVVRSTGARVDTIEDHLLSGRLETKRARLGTLRRLMVRLQRLLAPEPAALFRLLRKPPRWIGEADLQDLSQATEEFNVAISDMSTLQERIKLLQEEIAGLVAEANNRSLFVLTVVTVLALPINIIAGLMGMNVGGIPWADSPLGFWFVALLVLLFTLFAGWVVYRQVRDDKPG